MSKDYHRFTVEPGGIIPGTNVVYIGTTRNRAEVIAAKIDENGIPEIDIMELGKVGKRINAGRRGMRKDRTQRADKKCLTSEGPPV